MTKAQVKAPTTASISAEDVFEHAPCGLVGVDAAGRILRANAAFGRLVGMPSNSLCGEMFVDLMMVGSRLEYESSLEPSLRRHGSIQEAALDLRGRGGVRVPVWLNAVERCDDDGTVLSLAIAVFPANERSLHERDLLAARTSAKDAAEKAEQATQLREQLIAVLGHELRNPLAAMSSGVGILKRERSSERAQRVIALMEGSMVRASVLIDNVLDFARGRLGGGIPLELNVSSPLAPVIDQVISECRLIAPGQDIVADVNLPGDLAVDFEPHGAAHIQPARQRPDPRRQGTPGQAVRGGEAGYVRTFGQQCGRANPRGYDGEPVSALLPGQSEFAPARSRPRPVHRVGDRQGPRR